jgi:hypothetical protein
LEILFKKSQSAICVLKEDKNINTADKSFIKSFRVVKE